MDANGFDPAATLSPDDPLQAWLQDPAMAEFVKQKAIEHAQNVLGFAPSADPLGPDSGDTFGTKKPAATTQDTAAPAPTPPPPAAAAPVASSNPPFQVGIPPTSIVGRLKSYFGSGVPKAEGVPDPTASQGPFRLDPTPPPTTSPVPVASPSPAKVVIDSPAATVAPAEAEGAALDPEETSTDLSSKNADGKPKTKAEALSDFGKTLAGLKPMAPPPLNPVGTPSVRSPSAINAPNLSQVMQVMGLQSRPDPISTLGRLLVAGKA